MRRLPPVAAGTTRGQYTYRNVNIVDRRGLLPDGRWPLNAIRAKVPQ